MIWLLACSSPQRSDQALYLDSTTAERAQAAERCLPITDSDLRADCLIHAAARHARAGDITTAQATCQRIDDALWRDECWFLTADDAGLIGAPALEACRQSGRFQPHCRGHALGRAAQQLDLAIGQEAASAQAIGALVADYRPRSAGMKKQVMANELLAIRVAERWSTAPFDPALCGALPEAMCAWAYRASLDAAAAELAAQCPGPVSSDDARTIGLTGWTADGATAAAAVWAGICQQVADGQPIDLKPARLPQEMMPVE